LAEALDASNAEERREFKTLSLWRAQLKTLVPHRERRLQSRQKRWMSTLSDHAAGRNAQAGVRRGLERVNADILSLYTQA